MQTPTLQFTSCWIHWKNHKRIPHGNKPGIYVLAHWGPRPPRSVDCRAKEVVYIGETCGSTLAKRLGRFDRSARTGKHAHAGGRNYHSEHGKQKLRHLYVAVGLPPKGLSNEQRPLFIRFAERKLIWEYAAKHGRAPDCNKK